MKPRMKSEQTAGKQLRYKQTLGNNEMKTRGYEGKISCAVTSEPTDDNRV